MGVACGSLGPTRHSGGDTGDRGGSSLRDDATAGSKYLGQRTRRDRHGSLAERNGAESRRLPGSAD
jgi:hypothetical protein